MDAAAYKAFWTSYAWIGLGTLAMHACLQGVVTGLVVYALMRLGAKQ